MKSFKYITVLLLAGTLWSCGQENDSSEGWKNTKTNTKPTGDTTKKAPNKKAAFYKIIGTADFTGISDGTPVTLYQEYQDRRTGTVNYTPVGNTTVEKGKFEILGRVEQLGVSVLEIGKTKRSVILENKNIEVKFKATPTDTTWEFINTDETNTYHKIQKIVKKLLVDVDVLKATFKPSKDKAKAAQDQERFMGEYYKISKKHLPSIKKAILENAPSFGSSYYLFSTVPFAGNKDFYIQVAEKFKANDNGKNYSKALVGQIEMLKAQLGIGDVATDFTLKTPQEDEVSLSDFKGKIVLIDFWASWCGPCIQEIPNVKKAYDKYHNKGFEILSVSVDQDAKQWMGALEKYPMNWAQVIDNRETNVAQIYAVSSIPKTILVDKDGKILAINLRGQQLENKLKELF